MNGIGFDSSEMLTLSDDDTLHIGGKKIQFSKKAENLEDVKLPFQKPKYLTYPMFTALQGILKGYSQDKIWIYNNYILLWCDKKIENVAYWMDFKYANESNSDEFCPLVMKKNRENYDNNSDFIENVIHYIDNKIYFFISIDMYNVDAWWGKDEERWHKVHQVLVYGYNRERKEFITADFYNENYKIVRQ